MKKSVLVLVVFIFVVALSSSAFANNGCSDSSPGPIFTETSGSVRH